MKENHEKTPEEKPDAPSAEPGAAERIDAIAEAALRSVSARAADFRKKLPPIRSREEESARLPEGAGVETVEYRMPEAIRAMQEALLRTDLPKRREKPAQMREKNENGARFSGEKTERTSNVKAKPVRSVPRESRMQQLQRLADEVAEELPKPFFEKLDGGVALTDGTKVHPKSDPRKPLLILGEYRNDRNLGRSIMLYGGSIIRTYGHLPEAELKNELRRIIRHEFTHHIESLSGTRDLEIWDEVQLAEYRESLASDKR